MASNKTVLIGGTVIITVGYVGAITTKGNPTRVVVGGIVFVLLASLLELAGPRASALASGLVGVAVLTVVLVEAPAIQQAYVNAQKGAISKPPQPIGSQQTAAPHPTTGVGGPRPVV